MGQGRKPVCIFVSGFILLWIVSLLQSSDGWTLLRDLVFSFHSYVSGIVCGNGVIAYNVNYKQYHAILSPINKFKTELDLVILVPTHCSVEAADRRRMIRKTWANKTYTSPLRVQHIFVLGMFIDLDCIQNSCQSVHYN